MSLVNRDIKELKSSLIYIYDKLSNQSTVQVGLNAFKKLVINNSIKPQKMNLIIYEISEYIKKLNGEEKKEALILIPVFFQNKVCFSYLHKILSILLESISYKT